MAISPAMPWVKLHTNLLDDSRFARLDDIQKCRYFQLLMLAGRLDAGGFFYEHGHELSEDDIAWKLRLEVEILRTDLHALANVGLTHKNGRGWALPEFEAEQGPTQADKRSAWKARQNKHRHADVTRDSAVTHAPRLKIKSQIKESDKEQTDASASSTSKSAPAQQTDDADDVIIKIFKAAGAYKKHLEKLKNTSGIKPEDCWAMLAWNFNQENIRKPGVIMAMNLLDDQRAPANWYDESCWSVIPIEIRKAGGLVIQDGVKQVNQLLEVATRNSKPDKAISWKPNPTSQMTAEDMWQATLSQLQMEMSKASFENYVRDTIVINYSDGQFQIGVRNQPICDWLESRLVSKAENLLAGIANCSVKVRFVVSSLQEETPHGSNN